MESVVKLDDVSFSYNRLSVVKNISLSIREEEFLGIVGPNAGGKSTLLKLILGLLRPDKGDVTVMGMSPLYGRSRIGPRASTRRWSGSLLLPWRCLEPLGG